MDLFILNRFFFFLIAGTLFYAYKGRWLLTFIFSFLAALTRNVGVLLFFPLCLEYWDRYGFRFKKSIFALFGPPLGLVSYMIYLGMTFADPFAFIHAQKEWRRFIVDPLTVLGNLWQRISTFFQHHNVVMMIEIVMGISFICLFILSFKKSFRLPKSFIALYIMLLPALLQNTWASVNRYVIVIFPAFILLAHFLNKQPFARLLVLGGFALFLGLNIGLFVNLRWAG